MKNRTDASLGYGFSLIPVFSPVQARAQNENRFSGFSGVGKPLKRLAGGDVSSTRLKPGVKERGGAIRANSCNSGL